MVSSWLLSIISFKFLAREPLMQMFIDFKRLNDNFARNQPITVLFGIFRLLESNSPNLE